MILTTALLCSHLLYQEVTSEEIAAERARRASASSQEARSRYQEESARRSRDLTKSRIEEKLMQQRRLDTEKRELADLTAQLKALPPPDAFNKQDPNRYRRSNLQSEIQSQRRLVADMQNRLDAAAEAEKQAAQEEAKDLADLKAAVLRRRQEEAKRQVAVPVAPVKLPAAAETAAAAAVRLEAAAVKAEKTLALAQSKPEYAGMIPQAKAAAEKARRDANEAKFKAELETLK